MRSLLAKKPCGFFSSQFLAHHWISPRVSHSHPQPPESSVLQLRTLWGQSQKIFLVALTYFSSKQPLHLTSFKEGWQKEPPCLNGWWHPSGFHAETRVIHWEHRELSLLELEGNLDGIFCSDLTESKSRLYFQCTRSQEHINTTDRHEEEIVSKKKRKKERELKWRRKTLLPGKSEATGQATNIPQMELKQFKVSNYSGRDTPDSFNLLGCLDVKDQDILQIWERPSASRGHWVSFGFPLPSWLHLSA